MEESDEMKDFTCKNRACGRTVGRTDGRQLETHLGEKIPFDPHFVAFDCPFCGRKVEWRRLKREN
jgi:hypothetical protein